MRFTPSLALCKAFFVLAHHKTDGRFVGADFWHNIFLHLNLAKVLVYFKFQRYTKK